MLEHSVTDIPGETTPLISANRTRDYLRGAMFSYSPLNITLSLAILINNAMIIACYYKDRARFIPAAFIAIATANIVMAQGELTLCIVANLVYGAVELDFKYLIYCLYYFQGTAAVGETCSKFYNVVLSLAITLKVVSPHTVVNVKRVKLAMLIVTIVCAVLHFSDGAAGFYLDESKKYHVFESHINTISTLVVPGLLTLVSLSCFSDPASTLCSDPDGTNSVLTSFLFAVHVGAPPVIVFLSMVLIVFKLSRVSVNENMGRYVSVTVFIVSTLFFLCHATFLGVAAFSYFRFNSTDFVKDGVDFKYSYLTRGKVTGFAVFTLPLINAAVFPVILLFRDRPNFIGEIINRLLHSYRVFLYIEDSEEYPHM